MSSIESILRGHGLSDEPEKDGSSIHGWRCEYPDMYGRCDCFADLLAALTEHDRDVERDTLRLMIEHFEVLEEDGPADEIRAVLRAWRADQ